MLPRRRFLAASGALAGGALLALPASTEDALVHELAGEVLLNGERMTRASRVRAGDTLYTGSDGRLAMSIAGDAFFLRPRTELRVESRAHKALINLFRLVSGAMGVTFSRGAERNIVARTVTIGIRGTGVYLETSAEETYACTCFGATELKTGDDRMMERVAVVTANHLARRVYRDPRMGMRAVGAPFERHTNAEMARLEALAGRPDPFKP